MRTKKLKLRAYIENVRKDNGDLSPSAILEGYKKASKRELSFQAVSDMLNKMGLGKDARQALVVAERKNSESDIEDYAEVKSYVSNARLGGVQEFQINKQTDNLRKLWVLMGKTDPHTWTSEGMLNAVATVNPWTIDDRGRTKFTHPAAAQTLLSPYSTMFNSMGVLQKNWSANLCVHKAGELKDFLNFPEMAEFLSYLGTDDIMTSDGWLAMFTLHVNLGCREGSKGKTGITSLLWEDIDFAAKRCSLREKGHRGNAGERWDNLPLDLFGWLHGWEHLTAYWIEQGKPTQGNVFKATYKQYCDKFNATRKMCSCRIRNDDAAMRLHTFGRRTHAQYAQRLGIPLERICGNAPNGRFGVGWKDPKIPIKYYLSEEAEEIAADELTFMQENPEYSKVLASMQEQNRKIKELLGAF